MIITSFIIGFMLFAFMDIIREHFLDWEIKDWKGWVLFIIMLVLSNISTLFISNGIDKLKDEYKIQQEV